MLDQSIERLVVIGLVLIGLVALAGPMLLTAVGRTAPDSSDVVTAVVGAVAALLARAGNHPDDPVQVQVANEPADPVPVAETPKRR